METAAVPEPRQTAPGATPRPAARLEGGGRERAEPAPAGVAAPEARLASLEAEWVRRARDGDREAFESLYRTWVGRVHALCLRMTGDPAAAEEHTQSAFVRAWEKLPRFRGESGFGTWLHRIAANEVVSARRRWWRWGAKSVPAEELETIRGDAWATPAASPEDGDGADRVALERAIAALPERARQVLVLHDVEGYRHREIACLMGIAEGTSKAQLHRARKLLEEDLR